MIVTFRDPCIVFVHIPSTGGTALEKWFENNMDCPNKYKDRETEHLSIEQIKIITSRRTSIKNHYKFSVIRNPYDRAFSIYKHIQRDGFEGEFEHFMKKREFFPFFITDTMTNYLKGEILDDVFKYEMYPEIIQCLKDKFHFKNDPKILNINHQYPVYPIEEFKYAKLYEQNRHWVPIVNEIYADDFRNFDYQMLPW